MRSSPERLNPELAASKNAEAMNLVVRGRFREALRVLNEAIYSAPDYPHSYANRAFVFERLGMLPQAEADRDRARHLAEAGGYAEEEVFATPGLLSRPAPAARKSRREVRRQSPSRRRGIPEVIVLAVALVGMAATGFGIFIAANAISGADINLNVFDFESFQSSEPEATPGETAPPTAEPTPPPATPPPEALAGNPFSFSNLEAAWQAKNLSTTIGGINTVFTGFKATPFEVTLSRAGASGVFFLIIYPDRNGPSGDWNLGGAPSPKEGRRTPVFQRSWYNSNVVVLFRSGTAAIAEDAKSAFLGLGG